jgi:hypothetical protein
VTAATVTSDGSLFQDLAASEFRSAAAEHGVRVSPGKPPAKVAVAPSGEPRAVYDPGTSRLTIYGSSFQALQLSAELDPNRLPKRDFVQQFQARFHRDPGAYAAYGHEAMALALQGIGDAGTDASSFRDDVRGAVIGAHRDGTVLGSYSITSEGDTTECMVQRYRISGAGRQPLGAPCLPE